MKLRIISGIGAVLVSVALAPQALASVSIDDCTELQDISLELNGSYELTGNINCNGFPFVPIGTYGDAFGGTLDGKGYTISNVSISGASPGGLFGATEGGIIQNLHLTGFSVSGSMGVGTLVGIAEGSTIRNVSTASFSVAGDRNVGGLFGEAYDTTLERSYSANGMVEVEDRYGGGIAGSWYSGDMTDVYSRDSTIFTPAGEGMGGIAGMTSAGDAMVIANLYSNNAVLGGYSVGGLIGAMGSSLTTCLVKDSFFAGTVNGGFETGEIVGYLSGVCAIENSVSLGTPCVGADVSGGGVDCSQAGSESDFYSSLNAPLSSWDFGAVWVETDDFPAFFWTDESYPGTPTGATAVSSGTSIALSWTNPANAAFASITIRRSTSGYPSDPTDGLAVASGLTGTSFNDTGLTSGTRYYYSIFAKNAGGFAGSAATVSETADRNACQLEAYWKFDATPATPADASGNGYNGVGSNVSLSEEAPPAGFINPYSYAFNGTNSQVTASRPVADDFSICAWIRTTAQGAGTGTQHYLSRAIAHAEVGSIANDFGLGMDANERLTFGVGGPADYGVHGTTAINTGDWVHVCATRQKENGAIKLYVNGGQDGSGTGSTRSLTANATLMIGNGSDGAQPWDGLIDDVRVYDYALFPEEVADLADSVDACFGEASARSSSSSSEEGRQQGSGGTRGKDGNKKVTDMLLARFSSSASSSSHAAAAESPLQERTCARVAKRILDDKNALDRLNARLQKRFGFTCKS